MELENTDLAQHIARITMIDTHEHTRKEPQVVGQPPDVLTDLFDNYMTTGDLPVAGASQEAVSRLLASTDPDVEGRFNGVKLAWERCQHTGYGEAVSIIAREVYGLEHIDAESLVAAQGKAASLRAPGARLHLLKDVANLDHIQVDDFVWECAPDTSGPSFFLYDLSWVGFCSGMIDLKAIHETTGIEIRSVDDLDSAMEAIFARYAPFAIAVKSQHAYNRTLLWRERDQSDVSRILERVIADKEITLEDRLCLGDWCWDKGVGLAARYNLPFKIHTGYYFDHSRMPVEFIRAGHLCTLLAKHLDAKFVLMHIAYPYTDELVALAKHYPNVYVDMCWAWSIDPFTASDFVRRVIHAVPSNKLLGFGGDSGWPAATVGYAKQARTWLTSALQSEIQAGLLTEKQAIHLATAFMYSNASQCFDIEGTRTRLAISLTRDGAANNA